MESLVDFKLFNNVFYGRRVLVTGHTGFKGSWMVLWLKMMGADVKGYSLDSPTEPAHFNLLDLEMNSLCGDILDESNLENVFRDFQPEIVFHLAAQALVRDSYIDPVITYKTNVIGTLNVFEAARNTSSVKVIINVTSDKCYSNKEISIGYKETDEMGGYDPYSSSKGCAELLTQSYRNSFFNLSDIKKHGVALASVRAGNVIGGGDWAKDRLIPDIMRAVSKKDVVNIRNPKAVRPWQHVLEPLSGYLLLAAELFNGNYTLAEGWNFGPDYNDTLTVEEVVKRIKKYWNDLDYKIHHDPSQFHEATYLYLDCSKAKALLQWKPVWDSEKAFQYTSEWYKNYYLHRRIVSKENICDYVNLAANNKITWTL